MRNIIIMGLQGSGKSTIGKAIATHYHMSHISSGDIARDIASTDVEVRDDIENGKMAPEELMRDAILQYIKISGNNGMVLDGFPRFKDQDTWLYKNAPDFNPIYVAINCDVHTAISRLKKRQRFGDNTDAIVERIAYFIEHTADVINSHNCVMIDNDENLDINDVLDITVKEIDNYVNNR